MSKAKSFAEMTEDERIEWAKNHTWTPRNRQTHNKVIPSSNRKNAKKRVLGILTQERRYSDPEIRARIWGDDYNARIRYLYQHNEEFRELKKFRVMMRNFQKKRYQYDAWSVKYYNQYKNKMESSASVFRLENSYNFVNGFTIKDLKPFLPMGPTLFQRLIDQNIIPEPKYRGHKYIKDTFSSEVENFYLASEVEELLNVFARYRKKFLEVKSDEQKAYLKKQFWTRIEKVRENFDND